MFLASRLGRSRASLKSGTSLRKGLRLDEAELRAVAGALSRLPFMQQRHLRVAPGKAVTAQTVADLVDLVFRMLQASAPAETGSGTRAPATKAAKRGAKKAARKSAAKQKSAPKEKRRAARKAPRGFAFIEMPDASAARGTGGGSPGVIMGRGAAGGTPRGLAGARMSSPKRTPLPARDVVTIRIPVNPVGASAKRRRKSSSRLPRRKPRYANAALLAESGKAQLDRSRSLAPGQMVRLRLDIGPLSRQSQVKKPKQFPDDLLPQEIDLDLDVLVSSTDFGVATDPRSFGPVAHGRFRLPRDGGPAVTPDHNTFLFFCLKAPAAPGPSSARISYYYRNILVQSQQLKAHIGEKGGFTITPDYTLAEDLTGLDKLPTRPRLSVLTNANGDGSHQIVLRHPGKPRNDSDAQATLAIRDDNIGIILKKLRTDLAARAPITASRTPRELADDLRLLAPTGRKLYDQLPGQKEFAFFVDLYDNPDKYVVQVARPTTSSFVAPWSFIYDIPLSSGVQYEMCDMVKSWDGKSPLFAGSPRACPKGPHAQDVLCPFGFWGYRYAIEQLSSTDKLVMEISTPADCGCVVGETQIDVDPKALARHVTTLTATLKKAWPGASLQEGKDRATIEKLLCTDLPFVYFYCHGNRLNVADPNTWLGVGKNEMITASDVIGWPQKWYTALRKLYWDKIRPLVFINACHTLAIEPETLVSYLDAFVGRGHAAGVIGTEVKVNQTLAMDVAEKFFDALLVQRATVEQALRTIRIDYLRQGNLFGLVYTPYCWSELKVQ